MSFTVLRYVTGYEGLEMPQSGEGYEVLQRTGRPGSLIVEQLGFDCRPTLEDLAALIPATIPQSTGARFFLIDDQAATVEFVEVRAAPAYEEVVWKA